MYRQGIRNFSAVFGDAELSIFILDPKQDPTLPDPPQYNSHHTHPYYEMFCVTVGEASVLYDTETVLIREGEALLIPPGGEHQAVVCDTGSCTIFSFTVSPYKGEPFNGIDGIFSLFQKRLSLCAKTRRPFPFGTENVLDIQLLYSFQPQVTEDDYCCLQTLLYKIFYSLYQNLAVFSEEGTQPVGKELSDDNRMVLLLGNLINYRGYTQKEIARELGYSVSQTKRIIKKLYGEGYREIRMKNSLKSACVMLENDPTLRPEQAAKQSGFSDVSVMRNAFAKLLGCTPEEYRATHQNKTK